ncbi:hypothetical protein HOO68_06010 [Candidatus Gracilibacteria bacterium]|nr:hypothetical protein [Candidatus Gracilibacteria bacterium]
MRRVLPVRGCALRFLFKNSCSPSRLRRYRSVRDAVSVAIVRPAFFFGAKIMIFFIFPPSSSLLRTSSSSFQAATPVGSACETVVVMELHLHRFASALDLQYHDGVNVRGRFSQFSSLGSWYLLYHEYYYILLPIQLTSINCGGLLTLWHWHPG